MANTNNTLNRAKAAKADEFYTQLTDIEKEMRHYRKHFAGKTVFCNCDDPFESNFFKYFVLNFNRLKLKKLICTCYAGSPIANKEISLFDEDNQPKNTPYKAVVTTVYDKTGDGGIDMEDIKELFKSGENQLTELDGDGDFASDECLSLMSEADIVVTNPPFSQFRKYIATLIEHEKKFIILGSQNNITYKDVFPLLKENKMWLGSQFGNMAFTVPSNYEERETRFWIDDKGQKWRSFGNMTWFTNLDLKRRHEELVLIKRFSKDNYNHYDNYDAIDVESLSEIPCDYSGIMGVPLTIMQCHNPEQFEIVGFGKGELAKSIGVTKNYRGRCDIAYTLPNGKNKCPYGRILVRNKHPEPPKEV